MTEKISFKCPNCGQGYRTPISNCGKVTKCAHCQKPLTVPQAEIHNTAIEPEEESNHTDDYAVPDHSLNFIFGVMGSLLLMIGVFMPILKIPIVGSMNYFRNGEGDGVFVLILAFISLFIVLVKKFRGLYFTSILSLGMISFSFIQFRSKFGEIKKDMDADLQNNPFKGLAEAMMQTVELQWGWGVMLAGAILLLTAAHIKRYDTNGT